MDLLSSSIFLVFLVLIISLWVRWRKNKLTLFVRLGIPGPKPNFWTGNLKEIREKGFNCESEWIEKYGNIVGFYFGTRPILLVADPELLKTIQVKEFNDFMNKDVFVPYAGVPAAEMKYAIGLQKDQRWKFIRRVISPSFSIGKLKKIMPIFNDTIEIFLSKISQESKKSSFDIYPIYKKMVLDFITKTAFGISTNVQDSDDNIYLKCVLMVLNNGTSDILNFMSLCFPETEPIPTFLKITIDKLRSKMGLPSVRTLINVCQNVINKRKSNPEARHPDLLQNLIDSGVSKQELASTTMEDLEANDETNTKQNSKDKKQSNNDLQFLTSEEITANAMLFIIAGYDTTSSLLAFITHFLVNNQNIQDRVRREIMENVDYKEQINYENMSKFTYLNQVCLETLRLFPPLTSFVTRKSAKQFYYKNMIIPKDITLQAPIWHMQRDDNYWNKPVIFDPDRFSPENKSKINQWMYQPFGTGPRNCVGMRMALMIIKLTITHLLYRYKLLPSEETNSELQIDPKLFVNYPKNGIKLMAISN